ncbi:MAG: M56 family metallopeptidase [Clostridiales bacterium]|nr:M56 family metallopeptidase [Clostridiales bacterium]
MKAVLITSSILILLIAALRPVLRGRIDPRVQYALWLAVALRLLIPVNFADSAYSALALLERAEEPRRVVESIGQASVPITNPMSYEDAYQQALRERERNGQSVTDLSIDEVQNVYRRAEDLLESPPTLGQLTERYARSVWLGGAVVMALWFLLVNLRLRRKLRGVLPVEADCPLPVYVTPELPSPCLCGVVRPAIYITPAALESPDRLRHVLAHELTHYCHRDHWWALLRCLCLCVYWFDPLVWWAAALSRQDCELACDEGAIRRLGEDERLPYGRTLVDMIAAGHTPLLQTATTMTVGKRRMRERIKLIAHRPKTAAAVALALVIVQGLAVGCTFTGAPEESPPPEPVPSAVPMDGLAPAQQVIQSVVDRLMAELSLKLAFYPGGTAYAPGELTWEYSTVPSQDYFINYLSDLPAYFQWEYAPYSTSEGSDALRVSSEDGTVSLFLSKGSYLMLVEQGGETNCYKGQRRYDDDLPYGYLRQWFDMVELAALRAPFLTVDDNGQSHHDIAHKWALDYESAYLKCSPGNPYACTYVLIRGLNLPDLTDYEYLEGFAQAHGFSAEDFGKTWFQFNYSTVFVPVDDRAFWAGNTGPYEGDGAPEGALTYSRVGYMQLTDEGWTCMGVGTGG